MSLIQIKIDKSIWNLIYVKKGNYFPDNKTKAGTSGIWLCKKDYSWKFSTYAGKNMEKATAYYKNIKQKGGVMDKSFLKWRDSDEEEAVCYRENMTCCSLIDRTKAEYASRLAFEAGRKKGIMEAGYKTINFIRDYITKGG